MGGHGVRPHGPLLSVFAFHRQYPIHPRLIDSGAKMNLPRFRVCRTRIELGTELFHTAEGFVVGPLLAA